MESDDEPYSLDIVKTHTTIASVLPDLYTRETTIDFSKKRTVFKFVLELSPLRVEHQRQVYKLLDFLGDVGGLSDALMRIG